jgi:ABC-type glycerol-3-phosphate transport system permease component
MWDLLSKLSLAKGATVAGVLIGNLIAPFWYLFQFYPNIFKSNDLGKLILISLAIAVPITCINVVIGLVFNSPGSVADRNKNLQDHIFF